MALQLRHQGQNPPIPDMLAWPSTRRSRNARHSAAPGGIGSLAERHAARIWDAAHRATRVVAPSIARRTGQAGLRHRVALDTISRIATHVDGCARCWQRTNTDAAAPEEWLRWAIARWPEGAEIWQAAGVLVNRVRPPGAAPMRRSTPTT
jgi:hypothetical protein